MKKRNKKLLTVDLSHSEIVTLAVYLLGGAQHSVDTEDIAVKSHEMAPGRFSWRKYPEQINLELVRVYLSDAKKTDKGSMLIGYGKTGWAISEKGLEWVQTVEPFLSVLNFARHRSNSKAGSIDENRWRRERSRIISTSAWNRWKQGARDISVKEAAEVFRIDSYASGQLLQTKITRLLDMFSNEKELIPFLKHIATLIAKIGESK